MKNKTKTKEPIMKKKDITLKEGYLAINKLPNDIFSLDETIKPPSRKLEEIFKKFGIDSDLEQNEARNMYDKLVTERKKKGAIGMYVILRSNKNCADMNFPVNTTITHINNIVAWFCEADKKKK